MFRGSAPRGMGIHLSGIYAAFDKQALFALTAKRYADFPAQYRATRARAAHASRLHPAVFDSTVEFLAQARSGRRCFVKCRARAMTDAGGLPGARNRNMGAEIGFTFGNNAINSPNCNLSLTTHVGRCAIPSPDAQASDCACRSSVASTGAASRERFADNKQRQPMKGAGCLLSMSLCRTQSSRNRGSPCLAT